MVALGQVKFGEPLGAARFVQEGVDVRQWFDLRFCDGVETSVVIADPPRTVWLPCEHHCCGMPRCRMLDPTAVEQVAELAPQLGQFPF